MHLRRFSTIVLCFIFILILHFTATSVYAAKTIRIGILMDDESSETRQFIKLLQKEVKQLMGSEYMIQFPKNKQLTPEWDSKTARKNYLKLANDRNVDIVLIAGILSCSVLATEKTFNKPVIAVGIVDPMLQGVKPTPKNTSGVRNLTYIIFNRSVERDLRLFHQLYPYKKVGIAATGELLKLLKKSDRRLKTLREELKTDIALLPADHNIADFSRSLGDVDAVYLEYLGRFERTHRKGLIKMLNAKKIPTFGATIADLDIGALAAAAPRESMQIILRRVALNIEAALSNENLSELPVGITFEERLTINMKTARIIGLSPGFDIMTKAELINETAFTKGPEYTLKQVVDRAIKSSLTIDLKQNDIKLAEKDIAIARSNYFPTLTASLGETIIDQKRAKLSNGRTAERTANGKLSLKQLLFSEEQIGSVTALEHQRESAEHALSIKRLDTGLTAASAYINAVKAKTAVKIRKENVTKTRTFLAIAKKKRAVGYTGKADVYRLESNLATSQTEHLSALNTYRKTKIDLNRLLNLPLSDNIKLKESPFGMDVQVKYINKKLKSYIENPSDLRKYTVFLINEAFEHAPELKEIDAYENALKRRYTSLKRKRVLPIVSIGVGSEHIFDRSGVGSNIPDVNPPDNNWNAELNVTWSLFSGGSVSTEIQKLRIQMNTLKKQRILAKQSIEQNMRSAVLDTVSKAVNMDSSKISAHFADKSLKLVQDAYTKGTASITELTDAQNTALNASLNRLTAEYDFMMAVLTVERVAGSLSLIETTESLNTHFDNVKAFMENPAKGKNL